jgi:hypothetical protein
MQQQIRYYIEKSGEEPTVRSVKVARSAVEPVERAMAQPSIGAELSTSPRERAGEERRRGVKRLLRDAIRRRTPEA